MKSFWSVCQRSRILAKHRSALNLIVLCALLAGFSSLAFGQEATIVGTVTDPSGSVVPNVSITLTNTDTGQTRTMTTNGDGQYTAPSLAIGHYTLKAEAAGFSLVERTGIVL